MGRGRQGDRRRGPALPGMPELPPRRSGSLPGDEDHGVRLRRCVGGVHRGAGRRIDPRSRQRSDGPGRDPCRRGVDAVRRRGAHRQGHRRRIGRGLGRGRGRHPHRPVGPAGRSGPGDRRRHQPGGARAGAGTGRRLRLRLARREPAGQARRGHRRTHARRGLRRRRAEGDLRAGAGFADGRRPAGRGRHECGVPDSGSDVDVRTDPQAGARPPGLRELRHRNVGRTGLARPSRSCHARSVRSSRSRTFTRASGCWSTPRAIRSGSSSSPEQRRRDDGHQGSRKPPFRSPQESTRSFAMCTPRIGARYCAPSQLVSSLPAGVQRLHARTDRVCRPPECPHPPAC